MKLLSVAVDVNHDSIRDAILVLRDEIRWHSGLLADDEYELLLNLDELISHVTFLDAENDKEWDVVAVLPISNRIVWFGV